MKIRQKLALNLQFVFTYFFFLFGHSEALFCRDYSFQKHHIKDLCETQKSFTFLFSVCRYLSNDYFFSEKQRNKEGHKDFSWNHFMKFPKKSFSCKIRHHDVWLSFHRMSGRGFERCIDPKASISQFSCNLIEPKRKPQGSIFKTWLKIKRLYKWVLKHLLVAKSSVKLTFFTKEPKTVSLIDSFQFST